MINKLQGSENHFRRLSAKRALQACSYGPYLFFLFIYCRNLNELFQLIDKEYPVHGTELQHFEMTADYAITLTGSVKPLLSIHADRIRYLITWVVQSPAR